jgi:hypothetical protein
MGTLQAVMEKSDWKIEKDINIKKLFEDNDIYKEIYRITEKDLDKGINKELLKKIAKHSSDSEKMQSGKVWILVKEQGESKEILQVAQAIDFGKNGGFWGEIVGHVKEILQPKDVNGKYGKYAKEIRKNVQLCFYEIDIEKYLEKFAPDNYKDFIYKMAREYFVEASIAYFTQAREWAFYNSGMDKRALYYIINNIETNEIDKQKV